MKMIDLEATERELREGFARMLNTPDAEVRNPNVYAWQRRNVEFMVAFSMMIIRELEYHKGEEPMPFIEGMASLLTHGIFHMAVTIGDGDDGVPNSEQRRAVFHHFVEYMASFLGTADAGDVRMEAIDMRHKEVFDA